jgi:nitroimidazol reductase NimA-like FMN-containing flavoprotein (pyridoxamine 5'-phosphate oxidase superfamily)
MKEMIGQGVIVDEGVSGYLKEAIIPVRVACVTEGAWPLVVSLWYTFSDGAIFCATQNSAKLVRYLRNEPRCGFEVASEIPPYRGVRGHGIARINESRGKEILEILLDRYGIGRSSPLGKVLLSKSDDEVAIEIQPVRIFNWDYTRRMRGSLSHG